jgi:hypothetical protein
MKAFAYDLPEQIEVQATVKSPEAPLSIWRLSLELATMGLVLFAFSSLFRGFWPQLGHLSRFVLALLTLLIWTLLAQKLQLFGDRIDLHGGNRASAGRLLVPELVGCTVLMILVSIALESKLSLRSLVSSVFVGAMLAITNLLRRKKGMLPANY